MKKWLGLIFAFISSVSWSQVKHYLFIGMDRELLEKEKKTWSSPSFDGVQVAYSWNQLEQEKDVYDFGIIEEDMALLKKHGKKLFIQLQDVSFSMRWNLTAPYLFKDTIYHGGANKQYKFRNNNEADYYELGWVTRRWDPQVQARLHKLYNELGRRFDGLIEGVNTEETSMEVGSGPLHPPGFTFTRYRDAVLENILALRKAFPKSKVIVYANFMPGGYRPSEDTTLLRSVYEFAWSNNIGVGGPDLLPHKNDQMSNSYGLIRDSYGKVTTGLAVQDGTYQYINPQTGKEVTAEEIYRFGTEYLHLNYIFWGSEQPFLKDQAVPFLGSLRTNK